MNIRIFLLFLALTPLLSHAYLEEEKQEPPTYTAASPVRLFNVPPHADIIHALQKGKVGRYPNHDQVTASMEISGQGKQTWTAGCAYYNLKFLRDLTRLSPGEMCVSIIRESGIQKEGPSIHLQVHLELFMPNPDKFWFWEKDFRSVKLYLHTEMPSQDGDSTLAVLNGSIRLSQHPLQYGVRPEYFSKDNGLIRTPLGLNEKFSGQYLLRKKKVADTLPANCTLYLQ